MNFEKIKETLWQNRHIIILLITIFLLAFTLRAHLMRYDYIFEYDSYYHLRVVETLVETGSIPAIDPIAYYQEGGLTYPEFTLTWAIGAITYKIFSLFIGPGKETFLWVAKFIPAFFGALIAVAMYFLGKEIYNKKVGLIMAFMTATVPAFVYRTMAGFFEEDAIGFFWMITGMVFFVKAMKQNKIEKELIINAVIAGILFAIMAWTWRMHVLVPLVLTGYFLPAIIYTATKAKKEEVLAKIAGYVITIGTYTLLSLPIANWLYTAGSSANQVIQFDPIGWIIIGFLVLIGFVGVSYYISTLKKDSKKAVFGFLIFGFYLLLLGTTMFFIIKPDLVDRTSIGAMVGEESVGIPYFGTKYNSLIIFPIIALIGIPLATFFFKRKYSHLQYIIFAWTFITLFMAFYKLKFTYVFGLGVAVSSGFLVWLIFEIIEKKYLGEKEKSIETKVLTLVVLFMVLISVGAASIFIPGKIPTNDQDPAWNEAVQWFANDAPEGAKIFNWWGQGHILAFLTEKKVSSDNRNGSTKANQLFAEFVITEDTNRGYEIASKEIGADYVLLESSMFYSGPTYTYYYNNIKDDSLALKYRTGPINVVSCRVEGDNYVCGNSVIPSTQYNEFNSIWHSNPDDFYSGSIPIQYYSGDNMIVVLNPAMNKSNLAKVWFHSKETSSYYEEVFSNGKFKIFKIK